MNDKPYYEDSMSAIYHGDCREIMPQLRKSKVVQSIVTDPPYGINYESHHNSCRKGQFSKWVRHQNLPGIIGDDKPLNPRLILSFNVPTVIFGANYCANKLPPSRCWIIWDKRDGIGPNNQADAEMAWTNADKVSRIYRHLWSGLLRAGEENISKSQKVHPHQKPVALMQFAIKYIEASSFILDPYMGSGSTLRAAKNLGIKSIGIEMDEQYCEAAALRLSQEVFSL